MEYISDIDNEFYVSEDNVKYGSNYTNLTVWKKAHRLVVEIYKVSGRFPAEEKYGLISQLRRAAVSIPTNLAEGYGRTTSLDFKRFVMIAIGSANEVEYLLLLCRDIGYIDSNCYNEMYNKITEIIKMLYAVKKAIEVKLSK